MQGDGIIGISLRIVIDAATLFSFSGLEESKTYDYLATEGSLSVLGGVSDVDTAFAYLTEGTLFNFSGLEEKVVYDYLGSGTLFGFNNLEEARVYDYNCHDRNVIDYFIEIDHGYVERCLTSETITGDVSGDATGCLVKVEDGTTARVVSGQSYRTALNSDIATLFVDRGYIRNPANALLDYGHILTTSNVMPCGLFTFNKEIESDNKFTPNWNGSGTINVFGASRVPLDVSVYGVGFFKKLGGSAEAVAVAEETKDLFRVGGAASIGITAITINEGSLFGFSGAAEAVGFNPPEETSLFKISGGILSEKYSPAYLGEGVLFTLQTAIEKAVFDYVGSGSLFGFNNLEEARVYDYNCSSVVEFFDLNYGLVVDRNNLTVTQIGTTTISTPTTAPSGAVQILVGSTVTITPSGSYTVPNQLSVPQYFEDYGIVSERYDPVLDYGWILGTVAEGQPGCKYGQIDITGAVEVQYIPSWVGSGVINITGEARVPLDVSVYGTGFFKKLSGAAEAVAVAEESTDLFKITGTPIVGITAITINDGSLFGFSGAAEAVGVNPPDITTDLRLSGTSGDPILTHSEVASGTLFSFSGGEEQKSFAYYGAGVITLLPRKPETYELSELANYTLEDYETCGLYINLRDTSFYTGHTKLGCVQLKWLNAEESHEKHTEVYDLGLCNDEPEVDYGFIVNSNVVACVDVDGVINTDTSAGTGCTRVAPGTVLAIAPGVTYNIQPQISQATAFENYGEISEIYSPVRDYGHILDTTGIVCPFGSLGTIGNNAEYAFVRRTVGTNELGGLVRFVGDAEIFYTPPYYTEGFIGRIAGDGYTLFSLLHPGSGTLSYFGGSAETVRWSPDEEQLLFTTKGTAEEVFTANPPEEGTEIRLSGSTAPEILTFTEKLFGTISIFGESTNVYAPSYVGAGSLFAFAGAAEAVRWSPDGEQLLFKIKDAAVPVFSLAHYGSGFLSTISGAAEVFVADPTDITTDIKITGVATERSSTTAAFEGGTLFGFGSKAEAVRWSPDEEQLLFSTRGVGYTLFSLFHPGSGLIRVTPGVEQARALRPPSGGVINIEGTAIESFIANPPEDQILFRFTGDLDESFAYGLYTGDGNLFSFDGSSESRAVSERPIVDIRLSGNAGVQRNQAFSGSGGLFTFISTTESLTFNPQERQLLFSFTGAATEVLSANPPEEGTEIRLSGDTTPQILTFAEQPFGTISIYGESANAYVPNHIGSGSLFAFAGAAEAVGFNPPDITTDLKFFGTAEEVFTANPPEEGTEIRLSGDAFPVFFIPKYPASGLVKVTGDADTDRTRAFAGFGTLRKFSGGAESLTFNPEERDMLFSFTGGITSEKHTEAYVGVDTPIRIRRGALSDFETFDFQPNWNAFGVISVRGDAGLRYVPNNVGFGNIFTIGGSAESVTFNPDEKQMLFSFTGELAERRTSTHVGEGNLFAFSGGAERVAYAPSLLADIKFNGEATSKFVINNIGFGNIFNIGGASESVTFNPDERQLLFSFTGELVEAFGVAETKQIEVDLDGVGIFARSFAHEGFGTITITGDSFDRFVVNNIGFGNIFTIGGSAESVTFNPDEKQMLFSFTGELAERTLVREISQGGTITITGTAGDPSLTFAEQPEIQIALSGDGYITASLRHIGSGSLFAFSGGAEAVGAVPPTEQALFRVSGNSVNKFAADYVGDGSLRKLSGAAESVSFNPDERQMLFSFTGERISEKRTSREISQGGTIKTSGEAGVLVRFAHTGEGTISVTGDTKFTRARDFVGFGTIPVLSGAAESLTFNPDERDMLFSFTGERISEKTAFREIGTLGRVTFTGTSGDPLLTFAEQPFVNIDVTGDSVDVRTRAYQGTGRLFTVNNVDEAFVRTGYQGSGNINIDGIALVQVQLFQPPRTFVWII